MADVNTGSSSTLRVLASESSTDAVANESEVSWQLWFIERVSAPETRQLDGTSWSVPFAGVSGSFDFDWRPSGLQSVLIASGTETVAHNADGTGSVTVAGTIGDTRTSGGGPGATVSTTLTLTTLKVVPGTPTSVTAVRNSDAQATVSWAQSSASNGQPTSNTVRRKVNDGAWGGETSFAPATSVLLSVAANQKLEYAVKGTNAAGSSAWSATSAPIYTTPAAPSGVSAAKNADLDIVVGWTPNVGFSEHQHVVEHGTVTGGVTTWDGSPLATVASGTSTYKHEDPNPAQVHVYRVFAKNTDTGALQSTKTLSNQVQLLAAPNKPTLPTLPAYADKGKDFVLTWTHNPVDSTAQTAFEVEYSTNGGSSWTSSTKTTDTDSEYTVAADTYSADDALTVRVRTWGQATSGGSDSAGASPWSDSQTVTFKSRPVVTITSPEDSGTWTQADLAVQLGFSQAESASFVQATIVLNDGDTDLETVTSTTLASTALETRVEDGGTYTVTVTVLDSNGLTSDPVESEFEVAYTLPVAAGLTATYLPDSGITQLDLTIADPGEDEAAAVAVTIYRTIDGVRETIVANYPTAATLTILDTTPTIHGTNTYLVRTMSEDGATADTVQDLVTDEGAWAFLSTGAGYSVIVSFCGDLGFTVTATRAQALVATAGRQKPIALFGDSRSLQVSGSAALIPGMGSTPQELEAFIRDAGIICYRDPSGRRVFGTVTGSIEGPDALSQTIRFTVTEAE